MSFMFNPHPYDDYTPVNRPVLPEEIMKGSVFGAEKVMKALSGAVLQYKEENGGCVAALEGYPSADFAQFANGITCMLKGESVSLVSTKELCLTAEEIEELLSPYLPQDRIKDPVLLYGRLYNGLFRDLMDEKKGGGGKNSLPADKRGRQNPDFVRDGRCL